MNPPGRPQHDVNENTLTVAFTVYDGDTTRCKLDGALIVIDWKQEGTNHSRQYVTDSSGDVAANPEPLLEPQWPSCYVSVTKDGYAAVKIKCPIGWSANNGTVQLDGVHMKKK